MTLLERQVTARPRSPHALGGPGAEGTSGNLLFYVRALRSVRSRLGWGLAGGFAATIVVQAAAHATLATSAGLLGQTLVGSGGGVPGWTLSPTQGAVSGLVLCFVGFVSALVKGCASTLSMYAQRRLALHVGEQARMEVTDAAFRAGRVLPTATTLAILSIRVREVERGVDEGVLTSLRAVAHLIPLALALVLLSSRLALAAFAVLVPFALILAWARRRFRVLHVRAATLAEELHEGVDELVRHLDIFRTYGAEEYVTRSLADLGDRAGRASARADAVKAGLSSANEVLAALALLVVVALAHVGILPRAHGAPVAFAAVFFLMYRPLKDLGDGRSAVERGASALAALDRLRLDVGELRSHEASRGDLAAPPRAPCALSVVDLRVDRDDWTSPSLTFRAEPGEVVVVVGPTGAGKSTLLRALLGLERRVSGVVEVGGERIEATPAGPATRPFAWVPQEALIVSGTLAENVALGAKGPVSARAWLDRLGAGELADRVGDARLSPGGRELSGGERQWVCLARALASGLPVLLLDEPTSAMDAASEQRVLQALGSLRGERTVILVTHRPAPLAIADQVIQLAESSK